MNIVSFFFKANQTGLINFRSTQMFLLIWFIILSYGGIYGKEISREEDMELDRQLKILNKPAITTIQTIYGDTYNCVDFYQQPAFDHPLLKDHKFQFQMRPINKSNNQRNSSRNFFKPEKIWLNKKGCPFGTVPIRNVTKDDLIRAKLVEKIYSSKLNSQRANGPGVQYAVLRTTYNPDKKYYGARMHGSLYNQKVQSNQYSSIQMKIQNNLDTIIVGSTVNPIVYKDNKTRLFIYTTTQNTQCFNNLCHNPLFVLTSKEIPLDHVFEELSVRGAPKTWSYQYFVYKDVFNGNYHLALGEDKIEVGYWPQNVFTSLADSASEIEWGGEVYGPLDEPRPPMGSGGPKLARSTQYDAYCANIQVVDQAHQLVDPIGTTVYVDKPYHGLNLGNVGGDYQYLFFFGGGGTN